MDSSFVISKLANISMVLLFKHLTTFAINWGERSRSSGENPYGESMDISEGHETETGESTGINTNDIGTKDDMGIEQDTPGNDEGNSETDRMKNIAQMLNMSKTELDNA